MDDINIIQFMPVLIVFVHRGMELSIKHTAYLILYDLD